MDWYSGLEDVVQQLLEEIKKQWASEPSYVAKYKTAHATIFVESV